MLNFQTVLMILSYVINQGYIHASAISNDEDSTFIPCEEGWYFFGNNCYRIGGHESHNNRITWREAVRKCSNMGSQIVSIHSQAENDFISLFIALNMNQDFWIGLHDRYREGDFAWEDGSAVDYKNWNAGEPSNHFGSEDCVQMKSEAYTGSAGKWNDVGCESKSAYICKKESNTDITAPNPLFCSSDGSNDWKFRRSCFRIVNEPKSWDDAEEFCQRTFHGHLVTITDWIDDDFLHYILQKSKSHFWIGIKQDGPKQKWTSNWPVVYNRLDEPMQNGSCAVRWNRRIWTTSDCEETFPFICEKNSDTAPPVTSQESHRKLRCPGTSVNWLDHGGNYCYYKNTEATVSWTEAQKDCINKGGLLASINSEDEGRLLHHFIKDIKKNDVFIGLNNVLTNGKSYIWSDGKKPIYTNWAPGEPSTSSERCSFAWTQDMTWNDTPCSYKSGYICQIRKIPVDEDCGENDDCNKDS